MKLTKKLTSIILCVAMLMSFVTINSFALKKGDKIQWFYTYEDGSSDSEILNYNGKLVEGKNKLEVTDDWDVYEFEVKKDGCYAISTYGIIAAEKYDGKNAFDELQYDIVDDGCLYYFSEGTQLMQIYTTVFDAEITIEYYGEITDVVLSDEFNGDLISGVDIYPFNEDDEYYYSGFYVNVTFSNGKTVESANEHNLRCLGMPVENGENALELDYMGFKKNFTVNIHEITRYIESIELENLDKYTVVYNLYNDVWSYLILGDTPEKITVNFTDNTNTTVEYYCNYYEGICDTSVTLPNGKVCEITSSAEEGKYLGLGADNNDVYFIISIAGHNYIQEKCDVKEADFISNLRFFKSNIASHTVSKIEEILWCFRYMFDPDGEGFMYYFTELFSSYYIESIIYEISDFYNYYLSL